MFSYSSFVANRKLQLNVVLLQKQYRKQVKERIVERFSKITQRHTVHSMNGTTSTEPHVSSCGIPAVEAECSPLQHEMALFQ
jgi:hypothetical protein